MEIMSESIQIQVAKMHPDAVIPTKRDEDAGYDLYPCFEDEYMWIPPHRTVIIPTKLRVKIPCGYYLQFFERGSTGVRGIGQRAGVIDSGYTGELMVPITNHTEEFLIIAKKSFNAYDREKEALYPYEKAICQAVLLPVPQSDFIEVDESVIEGYNTKRGEGSLGSSGK